MGSATFGFKNLRAKCAGLLALAALAGPVAALTLDETVLSAGGTGSVVTGVQQFAVASNSLITPTDPFGGFAEIGVVRVTGLLDGAGQVLASGLGTNYGLYLLYAVTGTASPVPGSFDMVINYATASLQLFADRNNDSSIAPVPVAVPGGFPTIDFSFANTADDLPIALNGGTNFTGYTQVSPISATDLLGVTDATLYDWLLTPFGQAALAGDLFPNGLRITTSTLAPIVPTGIGPILVSNNEVGAITFVPEPDSLALAAAGGLAGLVGRRKRRTGIAH